MESQASRTVSRDHERDARRTTIAPTSLRVLVALGVLALLSSFDGTGETAPAPPRPSAPTRRALTLSS